METIKLELTLDEVKGILAVLGDMPTKSGAWVLLKKIDYQAANQFPKENKDVDK